MGSSLGGLELVRWRGLLKGARQSSRVAALVMYIVLCVFLVATQFSYVDVGGVGLTCALAPIAVSALMLGPRAAALIGGLSGFSELLHASIMPADTYERLFVAPWNSIALLALAGFAMGLAFALAEKRALLDAHAPGSMGRLWVFAVCILVCLSAYSILLSMGASYHTSFYAENALQRSPNAWNFLVYLLVQILGNTVVTLVLTFVLDLLHYRSTMPVEQCSLDETFRFWLFLVVSVAYMVVTSMYYVNASVQDLNGASQSINDELAFLQSQLTDRDELFSEASSTADVQESKVAKLHSSTIASVANDPTLDGSGVSVIAENGTVVSSNYEDYLDRPFEDVVGEGLLNGYSAKVFDDEHLFDWYLSTGEPGLMRAAEIEYRRGDQAGTYQIMVALPLSTIYYSRALSMRVIMIVMLGLFLVIYVLVTVLLRKMVMEGFTKTNGSLVRITEGDLGEVVDVRNSLEFVQLSDGINQTVSSLKESTELIQASIDNELQTARAIQASALPSSFPPYPDIDDFDIHATMEPARKVGGDFYDFFLVDDHTLAILIADVSGKGIPAALFMMEAKSEIGGFLRAGASVSDAIESANVRLCRGNDTGMFVTVWAATLDYLTGRLTYVNAGHNPPLLLREGSCEWLRQRSGIFLGAMDMARYPSFTLLMREEDELLLYTDGVTEACDPQLAEYGAGRLEALVTGLDGVRPQQLTAAVMRDLRRWANGTEQSDDITILALQYGIGPETHYSKTFMAVDDNIEEVRAFVHTELDKRRCPVSTQNKLDIALEELFINVCHYAYADDVAPGKVEVSYTYCARPSSITVQMRDSGVAFDPLAQADPQLPNSVELLQAGGLGIHMIKRCVDEIAYVREDGHNVITFTKNW